MRVLHLPGNIASQPATLAAGLRSVGVEARVLALNAAPIQRPREVESYRARGVRRDPIGGSRDWLRWWWAVWRALRWAAVVHWHFDARAMPLDLDLALVSALRRARLVEFWGSDIREPDLAAADNPFLARLMAGDGQRYAISARRSRVAQERFSRHGFACVVPGPELPRYVAPGIWRAVYRSEAVVDTTDLLPAPPDPTRGRPLVVHVPSNPVVKGTAGVLEVVRALARSHDFEFRLIEGVPHVEAMEIVRGADVVLDQFVIGAFGMVSIEAMAMAKPAVCYLTPAVRDASPPELPIVGASLDELHDVLAGLVADGERRRAIGLLGPPYVARRHDARVVAAELVGVYRSELEAVGRTPDGRRGA